MNLVLFDGIILIPGNTHNQDRLAWRNGEPTSGGITQDSWHIEKLGGNVSEIAL